MKTAGMLSLKNIRHRPVRTVILMLLSAFLAFTVFAGSVTVASLRNGLTSYEERLGADVVVVPSDASIRGELETIMLQGIPGYFYMNENVMDKIASIDGVAQVSPQFYLASAKSGCCSTSLQIIGFDPETDFTIQPWIQRSYAGTVGYGDVIIGNHVSMPANRTLTFYNQPLRIVAQLEETGTGLDNAVYAGMETVRQLIKDAEALGFQYLGKVPADQAISSVMIRVADGQDIDSVCNYINIHVRKADATRSQTMIAGIADGLLQVSGIIRILIVVIWVLACAIIAAVFALIANERKKEFAVLRIAGASRKALSRMLLTEALMTGAIGAVAGIVLAALIMLPFTGLIRERLSLPYLMPGAGVLFAIAAGALCISAVAGALATYLSTRRFTRRDTAFLLREAA